MQGQHLWNWKEDTKSGRDRGWDYRSLKKMPHLTSWRIQKQEGALNNLPCGPAFGCKPPLKGMWLCVRPLTSGELIQRDTSASTPRIWGNKSISPKGRPGRHHSVHYPPSHHRVCSNVSFKKSTPLPQWVLFYLALSFLIAPITTRLYKMYLFIFIFCIICFSLVM